MFKTGLGLDAGRPRQPATIPDWRMRHFSVTIPSPTPHWCFLQPVHMNIDSRQLICFREIAEQKSINRAALNLHITQPALSRRMQQLEHQLGTKLFERSRVGVDLTAAGRNLFERSSTLSEALIGIADDVDRPMRAENPTRVCIGISPGATILILDALVKAFRMRESTAVLSVIEGISSDLCDKTVDGALDVALISGRIGSRYLESEVLWLEPLYWVSPLNGISSLPFAMPTQDALVQGLIESELKRRGIQIDVRFEVCSAPIVKRLILQNHACSILPHSAISDELESGRLHCVQIQDVWLPRSLVWRKRTKPRERTTSMLEMLRELANGLCNQGEPRFLGPQRDQTPIWNASADTGS